MKKFVISLLLLSLLCITVTASVFPEKWSNIDRENFKTLYGDRNIEEFFEIANNEGFSISSVVNFLTEKQALIAAGLSVSGDGYLVDTKELEKAIEEEEKRKEELLASKEEELVIKVPSAPVENEEKVPLNTNVIIAVCAILLGGVFAVVITGKKKK